jgi:hypothetical protein
MLDLGAVPCLSPGVLLESTSGQSYLYNSESYSYALLDNEAAIAIVHLCDGARSIEAICEEVSRLFRGGRREQIQQDVVAMIDLLMRESFLQLAAVDAHES